LTNNTCVYLDTNIVIANIDEEDPHHNSVEMLLNSISQRRVVSRLTLVELVSVFSRGGLEDPVALAIFSVERAGARIVEVNFEEVLKKAVDYAVSLRLKTLDLLHVVISNLLGCSEFATLDKDIINKAEEIAKTLNMKILTPPSLWRR